VTQQTALKSNLHTRGKQKDQLSLGRCCLGSVAVEFAILLPFFLLVLLTLIETGYIALTRTVIEGAVSSASREVRTGEAQQSEDPIGSFRATLCEEVSVIIDCRLLQLDVRRFDVFPNAADVPEITGTEDFFQAGDASEITLVRVVYNWAYITPGLEILTNPGSKKFVASSVFKVEPFR
jgi:Flp pilus assembly protein TadG